MNTLYLPMDDGLLVLREGSPWRCELALAGKSCQCVAVDPRGPTRIYCGTSDDGLWRSSDGGASWQPAGEGICHPRVTAVAVAGGTLYAGTEPSAVFRSEDGGEVWHEPSALVDLPSSDTWSFPPRPETHHVRWIGIDPLVPERLFAAVEAGALVRSRDGGRTWEDRVPGGPYDTHTLVVHPRQTGRLHSAAGDGYFESDDGGDTWQSPVSGLRHRYVWGCAVDPDDPETVVVSAAASAWAAHGAARAESWIYRKNAGGEWQPVREGLPAPEGTTISSLAADPTEPRGLYAANNHGVVHSADMGVSWRRIEVDWPARYRETRIGGLAVG